MKKSNIVVSKIDNLYVSEDCVQIMTQYKNAITIVSADGILYHHKKDSNLVINKYLEDERKKFFPYSNIPMHNSKNTTFANQLLNFNQPYLRINDGRIMEMYAVPDNGEALVVNQIMPYDSKITQYKTKDELKKMFEKPSDTMIEGNLYLFDIAGGIAGDSVYESFLFDEEKIENRIRKRLLNYVNEGLQNNQYELRSIDFNYLNNLINFAKEGIRIGDLYEMFPNGFNITGNNILVKTSGSDITAQVIEIYYLGKNYYRVDTIDVPITNYTLEQLKFLSPKITKVKEPDISLRNNPGITQQDLEVAKKMLKTKKTV